MCVTVSIIMPAYNCANYIEKSILSVMNQTYSGWELIIVDDRSTDGTKFIIENCVLSDQRIKGVYLKENAGASNARNTAIAEAGGTYIAFLDSDDLWHEEKLMKQVKFMEMNDYSFTYTCYEIIDSKGNKTTEIASVPRQLDYKKLLNTNPIGCLTVMIKKVYLDNVNMPNIRHEDYATWLTILRDQLDYAYGMQEVLSSYRKHDESLSSNKLKTLSWTWNIYRNNQKLNLLKSSIQMAKYITLTLAKYIRMKKDSYESTISCVNDVSEG